MSPFDLSPDAQHWINVILVWIGFGCLSGLLARAVLPVHQPVGPLATLAVGIIGSAVGLLGLSFVFGDDQLNPISLTGFLAATAGAFALLALYHLFGSNQPKKKEDSAQL
jgi:uncharacterized membrane protein YeaQ/YmgE (transglycosylase-associated protein family)